MEVYNDATYSKRLHPYVALVAHPGHLVLHLSRCHLPGYTMPARQDPPPLSLSLCNRTFLPLVMPCAVRWNYGE